MVQEATKQLDNVVSLSELVVEMCFPSDGSCPEDLKELEIAEQDEDKGLVVRAGNLKNKAVRRGRKKLMTYKAVQATVDNVSADKVSLLIFPCFDVNVFLHEHTLTSHINRPYETNELFNCY